MIARRTNIKSCPYQFSDDCHKYDISVLNKMLHPTFVTFYIPKLDCIKKKIQQCFIVLDLGLKKFNIKSMRSFSIYKVT